MLHSLGESLADTNELRTAIMKEITEQVRQFHALGVPQTRLAIVTGLNRATIARMIKANVSSEVPPQFAQEPPGRCSPRAIPTTRASVALPAAPADAAAAQSPHQ